MAEYLIQDTTLTAIADSIRTKTGGDEAMLPTDMPAAIECIRTGRGEFHCLVIDYDGAVLAEDYLNAGDVFTLPEEPHPDRLVFDGWICSVPIIDNTITVTNDNVVVGATYRTATGATEIDIALDANTGLTFTFKRAPVKQSGATMKINWGDGTEDTKTTHTYSSYGEYTIQVYGMAYFTAGTSANEQGNIVGAVKVTSIRRIFFGNTVTTIEDYNFYSMYALESVVIPNTVTRIDRYAFAACKSLNSITIPSSITDIPTDAFCQCTSLQTVVIGQISTVNSNAFYECYALKNINVSAIQQIATYAFYRCYALDNITYSGTACRNYAFYECFALNRIRFEMSNSTIGQNAFYGCRSLKTIALPSSQKNLSSGAFSYCYALEGVELGAVTSIPSSAFSYCYSLKYINLPNTVTKIESNAFSYSGLRRLKLPINLATLYGTAFTDCYALTELDFSACTSVPTLSAAFGTLNPATKMLIPQALYDEWSTANNWSAVASYMVAV